MEYCTILAIMPQRHILRQDNILIIRKKGILKSGDITDIPRHGVYTEFDSRLLEDASFLRLKNLMLSYSLPAGLLKKTVVIRGLRVYAQAQNLLTFTNFSGLDPEGTTNLYAAQYPMSRQFTFGLDLMF